MAGEAEVKDNPVEDKPLAERIVRGSFQINLAIAGRGIQISGYINDGESKSDLNKRLDEAQDIITRQVLKNDLESKQGHLKLAWDALDHNGKRYQTLVNRKKKTGKLPTNMDNELNNFDNTITAIKEDIERTERDIEATKKRIEELT
jgi:hypothetical protein